MQPPALQRQRVLRIGARPEPTVTPAAPVAKRRPATQMAPTRVETGPRATKPSPPHSIRHVAPPQPPPGSPAAVL